MILSNKQREQFKNLDILMNQIERIHNKQNNYKKEVINNMDMQQFSELSNNVERIANALELNNELTKQALNRQPDMSGFEDIINGAKEQMDNMEQ